ncbi:MAG TPA: nuclease A inhibitor family protein [Pyrinomonadaceae bacterium]
MQKSDEEILVELKRLTEGLLFTSESDYPFETVYWKGLPEVTPQFLLGLSGQVEDAAVEIVSPDEFFGVAMSEESWRAARGRAEAGRYRALLELLKESLDELKVYKVGRIRMPVYIVGRTGTGNWLGISTVVVET